MATLTRATGEEKPCMACRPRSSLPLTLEPAKKVQQLDEYFAWNLRTGLLSRRSHTMVVLSVLLEAKSFCAAKRREGSPDLVGYLAYRVRMRRVQEIVPAVPPRLGFSLARARVRACAPADLSWAGRRP